MRAILAATLFSAVLLAQPVVGATLYESATGNLAALPGYGINADEILGSRFTLDTAAHVTGIGGTFSIRNRTVFGAIVEMDGLLPQGLPFNGTEVLVNTLVTSTSAVDDIAPVSITLPAGDYALVFGTQMFGATDDGVMNWQGTHTTEGLGSFFYWNGNNNLWVDGGGSGMRFIVNGTPVPEPRTALMLLSCTVVGGVMLAKRRRNAAG